MGRVLGVFWASPYTNKEKAKLPLLLVLAVIILLAGCRGPQTTEERELIIYEGAPIVCLGDSLTEGFGASRPYYVNKSRSYPAYLQWKIKVEVINAGITGDTAAGSLARLDRDVLSKDAQAVIILLGANDLFNQRPASNVKSDIEAIILKLQESGCKIYLASFIGDTEWEASVLETVSGTVYYSLAYLLPDYREMFQELSGNGNIEFISNIWKGVWGLHMSDPIHPNAIGYSIMANTIFKAIKPYLKENELVR